MKRIDKATLGAVMACVGSTLAHLYKGLETQLAFYMLLGALTGIAALKIIHWILEK